MLLGRESKRSAVVLLRWILVIATSYLLLFGPGRAGARTSVHLVVISLILSNVVLSFLPKRLFETKYFDSLLVVFDIAVISGSVWFSGQVTSEFYLLYFLIIMIAAVSHSLKAILFSAALVTLVYLLLAVLMEGQRALLQTDVLIRVPFFFVVAIFYGHLSQLVRAEHVERVAVEKKFTKARRLRELGEQLSALLDRQQILDLLVRQQIMLCKAGYAAVLSRGAGAVLAEAGEPKEKPTAEQWAFFSKEIERHMTSVETLRLRKPEIASDGSVKTGPSISAVHRPVAGYTLLPVTGQADSDLYLFLGGSFETETIEYAQLLLLSASLALDNAGQYHALVQEAETRQHLIRELGQALAFKSEFLANVSHEIRTPLLSFIGFGELLADGDYGDLAPAQSEVIERMLGNARSLLELINNLLDFSKLEAGEVRLNLSEGSVAELVREIADTCAPLVRKKPVSVKIDLPRDMPLLSTDWTLLRQVLLNLASNAIKFTPRGEVVIGASFSAAESQVIIWVRDSGIGIEEEKFVEIFESFRQLETSYVKKYAGTGLGLAISKKHTELLGGSIEVQSTIDVGSRFTVKLPVTVTPGARAPVRVSTVRRKETAPA